MDSKDSIVNIDLEQIQLVELIDLPPPATTVNGLALPSSSSRSSTDSSSSSILDDQIIPLLPLPEKPKINIFSVSYPRRKPIEEQITKLVETEKSKFVQFAFWSWSGSRYSGLLCMALSSIIYCILETISDFFTVESIPLFEIAFTRCTIMLIMSIIWLKKNKQPIFGPTNARPFLISRAITGFISLATFIYCIQKLPQSEAILLSFSTPIIASISAIFILHEKLKLSEIGGLVCSFFGVVFIFLTMREKNNNKQEDGVKNIFGVLIGLISSITAGISYCLVRAGAQASDQPLLTVSSFAMLASPATALCTIAFQEFVIPSFYTLILMLILGMLAFLAEITLARGLELEKTGKVMNIQYLEVGFSQILGMCTLRVVPSFGRLVGCLVILVSASFTFFVGPEKDNI